MAIIITKNPNTKRFTKTKPFEIKLTQEVLLQKCLKSFKNASPNGEYILGIDEAGRGPILGPMVYAGLLLKKTDKTRFQDSKALTKSQRESLFDKIKFERNYFYFEIPARIISETMLSPFNEDLDDLARFAIIKIIEEAVSSFTISHIFIDKIGKRNFDQYLLKKFNIPITMEPKADSKYQCVSGASIVAKVVRDSHIRGNMGSGYPGDPDTKKFLKNTFCPVFGWGNNIRYSWSTAQRFFTEEGNKKNVLFSFKTLFF